MENPSPTLESSSSSRDSLRPALRAPGLVALWSPHHELSSRPGHATVIHGERSKELIDPVVPVVRPAKVETSRKSAPAEAFACLPVFENSALHIWRIAKPALNQRNPPPLSHQPHSLPQNPCVSPVVLVQTMSSPLVCKHFAVPSPPQRQPLQRLPHLIPPLCTSRS